MLFFKKVLILVKSDQIVSHVTYVNDLYDIVYFETECQIRAIRVRNEQHERGNSHTNATRVLHVRR